MTSTLHLILGLDTTNVEERAVLGEYSPIFFHQFQVNVIPGILIFSLLFFGNIVYNKRTGKILEMANSRLKIVKISGNVK